MPGKFEAPRKKRKFPYVLLLIPVVLLVLMFLPEPGSAGSPAVSSEPPTESAAQTVPTETTEPTAEVVSTAALGAQGDLLMHVQVINSGKQEDGTYDFESVFRYISDYVSALDYAAVNLETTLGGSGYPYRGNPEFNCPDAIADAMADAGYDMALTANNHSSDTYASGMIRTLEQLRSAGLDTLGTMLDNEEQKYSIVDVNGIKLGMLCYTYATNELAEGQPSLNYRAFIQQTGIVNYFLESKLDRFYSEVEQHIASMKADGAEAIILYIHWGQEYNTTENATQNAMAQKLCDLGVDVIIGSHPHVVQPMELLESTADPDHKTICIYSVGNAVSNQMIGEDPVFESGHSEDGVLFQVTFEKYSDGTVQISAVDVLPTWVNRNTNSGSREYNILPLDISREDQWQELYGLTDAQLASAKASYDRTMEIVGEGLQKVQEFLQK